MKRSIRSQLSGFARVASMIIVTGSLAVLNYSTTAQTPQPLPPGSQLPDLKPPGQFVSVALNGGSPKNLGGSLTGLPTSIPQVEVPRNPIDHTAWVLEFRTRDGRGTINFSNTVPFGVPGSAFLWEQNSSPAPGAIGRLHYTGCPVCPASFVIEVTIKDNLDFTSAAPKARVQINLAASGGPPRLLNITRDGGDTIRPRFQLTFATRTFSVEYSDVIAVYAGGLKYKLLPQNVQGETMTVVIERLKPSRSVEVILSNHFGSSSRNTELPIQPAENGPGQFNCVSCSLTSGDADIHDEFSIKHTNIGITEASGTDTITITPRQSGTTPCDQLDSIYHTAVMRWIRTDGYSGDSDEQGTLRISSQPPVDHVLRSPDNKLRISWTLKPLKGDRFYQVMFGVIDVVGVCSNRLVP
jgi:hypothetical protein